MSNRGVLVTRSTAEWAAAQQRQSRPLTGHRTPVGQGIMDRPSGGVWFYGAVQSVDISAKTAVVRVDLCSYGHNPANTAGEVTVSWSVDAGVSVILPVPAVGFSYWFQLCHVPGDIHGSERSPPKWVRVFDEPSDTTVYIHTLAIKGYPASGSISWSYSQGLDPAITGTFAWNATAAAVEAALSVIPGIATLIVRGGPLPYNSIQFRLDAGYPWYVTISSHSLTREAYGMKPKPEMTVCTEHAALWVE